MKRFFQRLGMITLICLSFVYTEKVATVLIEVDNIMIKIKEEKEKYKVEPVNAIIKNNTIIPGINGREVNELKSYYKLKKIGQFHPENLEYITLKPDISLTDNYDKYIISGNPLKRSVALLFLVEKNANIDKIASSLKQKNVSGNFFVDSTWFENNNEKVISLIKEGHVIGNLSYNLNYNHSDFIWMDTIIKKVGKQENGYCYSEKDNVQFLKICAINKNYTIRPSIIVKKYPALEVKEKLQSGSIISLPVNSIVEEEIEYIIDIISNKGLKIVTLNELLSE